MAILGEKWFGALDPKVGPMGPTKSMDPKAALVAGCFESCTT